MSTAGCIKYSWRKTEAAAQNRAEDGEELSVTYVLPTGSEKVKLMFRFRHGRVFVVRFVIEMHSVRLSGPFHCLSSFPAAAGWTVCGRRLTSQNFAE